MKALAPVLDPRDQHALLAELLARVPGFAPTWRPRPDEAGWALLSVYARYLEILAGGLNRLPDRALLGFLDVFGSNLLPARSARAPLVFKLLDTSPRDVELPARSLVAAKLPPPPSLVSGDPAAESPVPLFYTDRTVTLTRARLSAAYTVDPAADRYTDHSAGLQSGFTAFDDRDAIPHLLYLGHDQLFALAGSAEVVVSFSMASAATGDRKLVLAWEYLSQDGWLPLTVVEDTTARLTTDGTVTLSKDYGPDARQETINGRTSYWIRALVSPDPPRASVLAAECLQIHLDSAPPWAVADVLRVGGEPRAQVQAMYGKTVLLQKPAPFAEGEVVTVVAKPPATVTQAPATHILVDAGSPFQPGDRITVDGDSTAQLVHVFRNMLELDGPLPGLAMGVRITMADARPPLRPEGTEGLGPLPTVDLIHARVGFTKTDLQVEKACSNTTILDTSNLFHPFGKQPETFHTFYLASTEVFQRQGARIELEFVFARKGTSTGGATLVWEYFDGTSWRELGALQDLQDGTNAFTKDGAVSFVRPSDWAEGEVKGEKNFWLRARLGTGDYGHPLQLKVVTDGSGNTTVQADPSTLAPPLVSSLRLRYTYLTESQLLDHCLTYSDFTFVDHTEAARWLRSPFSPFTPNTDRDPALHLGFTDKLPSALVSFYVDIAGAPPTEVPPSPLVWEYLSDRGWSELVVLDETRGLAVSGMVQWVGAADAQPSTGLGGRLYRVRARVRPGERVAPAEVRALWPNALWGVQGEDVQQLVLGDSSGEPSQSFPFPGTRVPVLPGETIELREWTGHGEDWETAVQGVPATHLRFERDPVTGVPKAAWVRWTVRDDFFSAAPADRVYVIERTTGMLRFGDGRFGMIPPAGARVSASYATGGGLVGNVPAGAISELRTGVAYLESVHNPVAASGGAASETTALVRARGPQRFRHRHLSVSAADYEWMAREASPDVARVRCLPLTGDDGRPHPGRVTLLLAPQSTDGQPRPTTELSRRVRAYIASRCPVTVSGRVRIVAPAYVPVSVRASIAIVEAQEAARIEQAVRAALDAFLHPLAGGPAGDGWQFGDKVWLSQLAALVEGLAGVDYCSDFRLAVGDVGFGDFVPVVATALPAAGEHQLKIVGRTSASSARGQ